MSIVLSEELNDEFEPRYLRLKEQLSLKEEIYAEAAKNYKDCELEACTVDVELKQHRKACERAKGFVRIYSPVVDDMQQEIDRVNAKIAEAKSKKISSQYTAEMRDEIIENLKIVKEPAVKKRDEFNSRLKVYTAERDSAQAEIDKLAPELKLLKKDSAIYKDKMQSSERTLKKIRLDIKKLKTEYLTKEIKSRSDYKRFDTSDCFVILPAKLLFKFWDKKPHVVNGNYSVYAGVDILEVTESQVVSLSVININGKFFRAVTTEYEQGAPDFMRIEFVDSENDEPNVKVNVSEYAVNLYYLLYGLNSPSYMMDYTDAAEMLTNLIKHRPVLLQNLPLYVFGSAELEKIVTDAVKDACTTIVTNYKKKNGGEMPEEMKQYIKDLGKMLKDKQKQAAGAWRKQKLDN